MNIRHDRRELLDKIIDQPIQLVQKLQNHLNLDVYSTHYQATIFGKKCSNFLFIPDNGLTQLSIGSLSNDKYVCNLILYNFFIPTNNKQSVSIILNT